MLKSGMSSPVSYDLQGQGGGVVLNAGNGVTGEFRWIQVVTDTVLNVCESNNLTQADARLISITLPAGLGIGGRFQEVSVTSGVVIVYYA